MRVKYLYEDVKEIVENSNYELLSTKKDIVNKKGFVYTTTKIKVWCKNSNHKPYMVVFNKFKLGQRCGQCAKNKKLTHKEVKEYIESFGYEMLDEYKNSNTKIIIKCQNGHVYKTLFHNFKKGQRCKECQNKNIPYTHKEVKEYIESFGYELISNTYINCKTKLLIKCPKGHIYEVSFDNFKRGRRCPYCKLKSKGEEKVKEVLEKYNIDFIRQYTREDCKYTYVIPFDFYIQSMNTIIEYDGIQHFESIEAWGGEEKLKITQEKDNIKNQYCQQNNIKLIRISYLDFNDIEKILIKELNLK